MSVEPEAAGEPESRLASIGNSAAQLRGHEMAWRDKQRFLEERGYMLRPRFHPEWVPSWISNGQNPMLQEDFHHLPVRLSYSIRPEWNLTYIIVSTQLDRRDADI